MDFLTIATVINIAKVSVSNIHCTWTSGNKLIKKKYSKKNLKHAFWAQTHYQFQRNK